jgi:nicotinate-nucleotide pyrophosphorylase (carboxylating)
MLNEFVQMEWNSRLAHDCRELVRLAIREDLDRSLDWTTALLVPSEARGRAEVVAREEGIVAGLPAALLVATEYDPDVECTPLVDEGAFVAARSPLIAISGPARSLLTLERVLLNVLGRLCGIATLTHRYVQRVEGTKARVYDTRKTTPGWRRLEKYAVRKGGGHNHRTGLFDSILIKDNHLAFGHGGSESGRFTPAEAVEKARRFVDYESASLPQITELVPARAFLVEVEVESLDHLEAVLPQRPDVVMLDNMSIADLRAAVAARDRLAPAVELEASGGVHLETVGPIARTGVDRISVGALTHSARSLDVALDWFD